MQVQKEWLDFLRDQYPKGTRIRLTEMKDDPYALAPGSMGTLNYIDDDAQFHIRWDNGSGLALRIGEDRFQVLPQEPQTLKFYMPLTAQLYINLHNYGLALLESHIHAETEYGLLERRDNQPIQCVGECQTEDQMEEMML